MTARFRDDCTCERALVEAWIEETGGEYLPSGQLTHKRADLERGFEPDECYYIQNWKKVGGLRELTVSAFEARRDVRELRATAASVVRAILTAAVLEPSETLEAA